MNDKTDQEREERATTTAVTDDGVLKETTVEKVRSASPRRRRTPAIVAILAVVAIAGLALILWLTRQGGAGRPVPVPRGVSINQPSDTGASTASAEPTLTLAPDVVARAGIKVEVVGERLAAETGGEVATGVVQPNAYRETPVVSLVGGIVRSVNAELGQSVGRGQTLAVVFSNELADAQSRYLDAVAMLDEHHKHHERTTRLVAIGAVSREEYEQATTKLRTAESEVASLRQRLLLLGLSSQRVASLRSASQVSSEVNLASPVSGTVTSRSVNVGEVVEANKELLRITDLSSVWVVGQVYEKDLARIRVGSGVSVTATAYPGRVYRGRVSYVDPRLDPTTRTAQVRIELANPGHELKIGMYVNVAFATVGGSESTQPVVPASAVQNIGNQQAVFVATNDPNVFILRPVRLGLQSNGYYPVLEGLTVGERIVSEGSFMLRAEWLKTHG
jgi:RND family efflux transporter MFP subunit